MAETQRMIHYSQHGAMVEGDWEPPQMWCQDPACIQDVYGIDVSVLTYSLIDCVVFGTDDEAIEWAPRINLAYAERMQSRQARRARMAASVRRALGQS